MSRNELTTFGFDPFDLLLAPVRLATSPAQSPKINGYGFNADIKETDDAYTVLADFPGADKNDIDVKLDDDVLTISYEKSTENDTKDDDGKWLTKERSFESATRSFSLPDSDENGAKASFDNGVLTITVSKKKEQDTSKTIDID